MMGMKSEAVQRDPAARDRRGRAPRLPGRWLTVVPLEPWRPSQLSVADICAAAKRAARALARADTATKNAALEAIAAALEERTEEILEANARDMQAGREADLSEALLDRLLLDEERIAAIAKAVRQIVALGDPVGEVIDGHRLPNGLDVRKVRVPLGVVAVVYEARPNVTIDAAALCLKSGNAIVLRGSSSALHSNAALARIAGEAAVAGGLPEGCVSLVAGGGREELAELATQKGTVDLIIPRGGEGLKAALEEVATVPVIYAASGNCHVYVDASARSRTRPRRSCSTRRRSARACATRRRRCSCTRQIAAEFVPRIVRALGDAGVVVRADERTSARLAGEAIRGDRGGERGGLGHGVPGDDAGREGASIRRRRRSSTSAATAAGIPRRS